MKIEPLGVDKDPFYAAARRVESILDEAVLSGALTPDERRIVGLYQRGVTYTVRTTVASVRPRPARCFPGCSRLSA